MPPKEEQNMKWIYDDGGRSKYFKAEHVGDCVCRAISIATGMDYKEVYDMLNAECKTTNLPKKRKSNTNDARNGVYRKTFQKVLKDLGWVWHPVMSIGSGCTMHMKENELPAGTLIISLSRHLTCVKDGVLYDTYDCTREGTRCVYGYYTKGGN